VRRREGEEGRGRGWGRGKVDYGMETKRMLTAARKDRR
jgi:hypothetical protein